MSLSTLGFVEFADGDDEAADQALVRMRELTRSIGAKESAARSQRALSHRGSARARRARSAQECSSGSRSVAGHSPVCGPPTTLPRAHALVSREGDVGRRPCGTRKGRSLPWRRSSRSSSAGRSRKGRLHRRANQKRLAERCSVRRSRPLSGSALPAGRSVPGRARADGLHHRSPRRADGDGAARRRARGRGDDEPRGGDRRLHEPEDRRGQLVRVYRKLGIHSRAELGALDGQPKRGTPGPNGGRETPDVSGARRRS